MRRLGLLTIPVALATLLGAGASCEPGPAVITMPIRWCVLAGSSEAGDAVAGDLVSKYRPDEDALARATEIWAAARIWPIQMVAERGEERGVPVINDPSTVSGQPGDIDATGGDPYHSAAAATACDAEWRSLASGVEGIAVVTARKFINGGATLAGASSPPFPLWVAGAHPLAGKRGDDLCGHPRQLTGSDVYDMDGLNGTNVGWVVIAQPDQFSDLDHRARALAHELGHVLFLSHGNGIDDNGDGSAVGAEGPRRFDAYCDPSGPQPSSDVSKEDLLTLPQGCDGSSLMNTSATCTTLTPLQIEQARAVAMLLPGSKGG